MMADVVIAADGVNSLMAQKAGWAKMFDAGQVATGVKQIIELSAETISQRFQLEGNNGAALLFVGDCSNGMQGGGFLYTNKSSISLGLVINVRELRRSQVKLCDLQSKFSSNYPDVIKCKREMAELRKMTGATGGSPSLQRQKLTDLKAELAEKLGHYSDQHPEVIKLKKEIAELEKMPTANKPAKPVSQPDNPAYVNLLTNIDSANNDIESLKRQKVDLEGKLQMYRKRLEDEPKVEQEYLGLTRDYQNASAKHQEILNKIMEARIAEGMEESQKAEKFTIIDPASFPEKPVAPKRGLIALAGLILGLGAGLGMVALAENLDHTVKSTDELAWLTGLPVLGRIVRIITPEDIARQKHRRHLIWSVTGASIFAGILIFHFFVMDLWILYARVGRFVGKFL
jgi:hypothetical protein